MKFESENGSGVQTLDAIDHFAIFGANDGKTTRLDISRIEMRECLAQRLKHMAALLLLTCHRCLQALVEHGKPTQMSVCFWNIAVQSYPQAIDTHAPGVQMRHKMAMESGAEHVEFASALVHPAGGIDQAQRAAVEVLLFLRNDASHGGMQPALVCHQRFRHIEPFLRRQFCRRGRCGGTHIGDKIGDRGIRFVTDAADDGQMTIGDGAGHDFRVECPQIFHAATAADEQQHIAFVTLPGLQDGCNNAVRGGFALYGRGVKDDGQMRSTSAQGNQDIMHGGGLRRTDDTDSSWKPGEEALSFLREQTGELEFFLEAGEFLEQASYTGAPHGFDRQLEVSTWFIEGYQDLSFDVLPVFQSPGNRLRTHAEHDATHLGGVIFQAEVDMARGCAGQIGHFARYPAQWKPTLQNLAREAV